LLFVCAVSGVCGQNSSQLNFFTSSHDILDNFKFLCDIYIQGEVITMNGWGILNNIINATPMAVAVIISSGAAIVFVIGFAQHGTDFIKSGFKQAVASSTLEKRFDMLTENLDRSFESIDKRFESIDKRFESIDKRFDTLETRFEDSETNLSARIGSVETKLGNRIDDVETKLGNRIEGVETKLGNRIEGVEAKLGDRIDNIENNHFAHLKSYLGILNGVLLDQKIINNETKARLDNELNGM
jgi:chaperonin cofactor prefoldin